MQLLICRQNTNMEHNMLIDTHCHLFSKEMIAEEFLRVSNNFQDIKPEQLSKRLKNGNVDNVLQFISHGMDDDCYDLSGKRRKHLPSLENDVHVE